jgi:hypothetical protein
MKQHPALQSIRCAGAAAFLLAAAAALPRTGLAADPTDENWPCVQRKVPQISAGQIWSGPSLDEVGRTWLDDPTVSDLARHIAARRTEMPEAQTLIGQFADGAGAGRNHRLTLLAAGVLSLINRERASIIAGIERYATRQKALAAKIEQQTAELQAMPVNGTETEQSQRADLQEIQDWDTRIFQEREHSLTYVCDLPVQLERRAFALGREIQQHLAEP